MVADLNLQEWLRRRCGEYSYNWRGVFRQRGSHPWPLTAADEADLETQLAAGGLPGQYTQGCDVAAPAVERLKDKGAYATRSGEHGYLLAGMAAVRTLRALVAQPQPPSVGRRQLVAPIRLRY